MLELVGRFDAGQVGSRQIDGLADMVSQVTSLGLV
jgi:hypothetical protein